MAKSKKQLRKEAKNKAEGKRILRITVLVVAVVLLLLFVMFQMNA